MPKKRRWFMRISFSRRCVSLNQEFPPSMRMSPGSSSGESCAIMLSTGSPALIIIRMRRGVRSALTNSSSDFGAGEAFAGILLHEALGPIGFQVPDRDAEAVLFNVEGKILPHNAKSDHSEITHTGLPRSNATFAGRRRFLIHGTNYPTFAKDGRKGRAPGATRALNRNRLGLQKRCKAAGQRVEIAMEVGAEPHARTRRLCCASESNRPRAWASANTAKPAFSPGDRQLVCLGGGDLQKNSRGRPALVELPGRMQESRAVAGGDSDTQGFRSASCKR